MTLSAYKRYRILFWLALLLLSLQGSALLSHLKTHGAIYQVDGFHVASSEDDDVPPQDVVPPCVWEFAPDTRFTPAALAYAFVAAQRVVFKRTIRAPPVPLSTFGRA